MRGIADQIATRLTRLDAAFNADKLGMICWAYSKLQVRRCLKNLFTTSWLSWTGMCMLP